MSKLTVGWIGLGSAGYPMAACLGKKGYRLLVRDADPERAAQFVQEYPNCAKASVAADAFRNCDAVVTMLPNGRVVRNVLLDEDGIGRHLKPGIALVPSTIYYIFLINFRLGRH